MARKTLLNRPIAPDPCPHLAIERGPEERGVGSWVPTQKHRLLTEYLFATSGAWKKWPSRVFIDPFSGPGRVQVAGETVTRDGGAVIAWRALAEKQVPFTKMLVGDLAADRSHACESRLRALGPPSFHTLDQRLTRLRRWLPPSRVDHSRWPTSIPTISSCSRSLSSKRSRS